MTPLLILFFLSLFVFFSIYYRKPPRKVHLPSNYAEILSENVAFYRNLDQIKKEEFENRIREFLGRTTVEGVGTDADDLDRLLVAASAVIPVFYFPSYRYFNLRTVLLYPNTFNKEEFLEGGYEKNTLGMVGTGPLQGTMILSKTALLHGFLVPGQPHNTGIHEFVHLLDKEDGDVDGIPEALIQGTIRQEWIYLMEENQQKIRNGMSDISVHAATSRAEFLCIVSEYFFNAPEKFALYHPGLYGMLKKIYQYPA